MIGLSVLRMSVKKQSDFNRKPPETCMGISGGFGVLMQYFRRIYY